jgi:hypothetical protein
LRVVALLCLASSASGCERHEAARFPTQSDLPDTERRAAGIAVDLNSSPPPSVDQASTDHSVVSLRAPLGLNAAHDVISAFFEAVYAEDVTAMSDLVRPKALVLDMRRTTGAKSHIVTTLWRQRFQKRDYQALGGQLVYRQGDVATYRGDQLGALPLSVRYLDEGDDVRPNDLVLRVPVITHSVRNERLFGDEVFFWLRRRGSRYVIYRMAEEVPF